jgi:hypothetical protein
MTGYTYRGRRLDAGLVEFHRAVDLLQADTVPLAYVMKVWASEYERDLRRKGAEHAIHQGHEG